MGILNVTPDSFSDGGHFFSADRAVGRAVEMVEQGASIIDIGGESTRPDALPVDEQEELRRVIPVIEKLRKRVGVTISVDTSKPIVMRAALDAGADVINDVMSMQNPGSFEATKNSTATVCLMHMKGEPRTMQRNPQYVDVVAEVKSFLLERVAVCERNGISRDRIWLDPGFGFGKTLEQNWQLFKHLPDFAALGFPVLVGVSRKSMIGNLLNVGIEDRLAGSLAAAVLAVKAGAKILRVHDVKETAQVLKIIEAAN